jgi:cyclopropane-fatty-acyl-phospholipid synthase
MFVSDLAQTRPQDVIAAALPDLKKAPAIFRTAVRLAAETWLFGGITFVLPSGREIPIRGAQPGPQARVIINDYRFMGRVMAAGDIGFAEGYMDGEWDTPDLTAVLESASLNFDRIGQLQAGNPLMRMFNFFAHLLNRNSRKGSQRNIHAHYDLGNAFYERWLDPTMTYSAARFETPDQCLSAAQQHKYATLAKQMGLGPDQHVLEIGCGWGGFAEFAARDVGARVTGITISREQHDFAKKRLFEQGLADKADIRLIDYRDVEGRFDRIASIEMFEAVGEAYWPTYFGKLHDLMSPGGRAALQIITIRDELFDDYRSRADFIQKYVFPGGMLGSERRLREETDRAGLEWRDVARFGQDYAETLGQWGVRFQAAWSEIRELGFDERFRRLWQFYLSYCEAGFRSGRTNVIQLGLARA